MPDYLFTHKEKTEKRHNVAFIAKQVKAVLNDYRVQGICCNQMPEDFGQLYTTHQASRIIADVVSESRYYARQRY